MTTDAVISVVDALLKPLGFLRRKSVWNRKGENYVDVVTLQRSKSGDRITMNVGVLSPDVFRICWGDAPHDFADETACTVQYRLGQWTRGREQWWQEADASAPEQIVRELSAESIPFLKRMRSPQAMARFLSDTRVEERGYPPPIIYLAILKHQQGDSIGACAMLRRLRERTPKAWKTRIDGVMTRLSCLAPTD